MGCQAVHWARGRKKGVVIRHPPHLTRIEETQKDMEQHLQVHKLLQSDTEKGNRPKLEAISRPVLKEGSSEGAYQFFVYEWKQYKESSCMTDQEKIKQLIHCVSSDVRRKVFESTMGAQESEETILKHLKRLCVKSQNRLVNIVEFGEIAQGREEPVAVTLARLKGSASNCGFKIRCSKEDCNQEVDFSDEMIAFQLIRGLADPSIQEEVLSKEASTPNMKLDDIIKIIEAKEQGKRSQNLLGSSSLNSIRSFNSFKQQTFRTDNRKFKKCFNCGLVEHGISRAEKQKSCKAFKHKCGSCGKMGHFESTCRSKRGEENLIEEDVSDPEEVRAFGEIFALEKLEKSRFQKVIL